MTTRDSHIGSPYQHRLSDQVSAKCRKEWCCAHSDIAGSRFLAIFSRKIVRQRPEVVVTRATTWPLCRTEEWARHPGTPPLMRMAASWLGPRWSTAYRSYAVGGKTLVKS